MKAKLFKLKTVKAILSGSKSQFIKPIKKQPKYLQQLSDGRFEVCDDGGFDNNVRYIKPTYKVGDLLYAREDWYSEGGKVYYRADANSLSDDLRKAFRYKWNTAMYMPKECARLFLEITNVRTIELHTVSTSDIVNEGVVCSRCKNSGKINLSNHQQIVCECNLTESFKDMWNKCHGNWDDNPFVWIYEFKKIINNEDNT